jgi:hypothetical protein
MKHETLCENNRNIQKGHKSQIDLIKKIKQIKRAKNKIKKNYVKHIHRKVKGV